nr:hypothetical protein [Tanacetum cinerariifolium]
MLEAMIKGFKAEKVKCIIDWILSISLSPFVISGPPSNNKRAKKEQDSTNGVCYRKVPFRLQRHVRKDKNEEPWSSRIHNLLDDEVPNDYQDKELRSFKPKVDGQGVHIVEEKEYGSILGEDCYQEMKEGKILGYVVITKGIRADSEKIMKPVHRARKASKLANEDVISRMPENVITDIMNRLPIRDAMRTSNLAVTGVSWLSKSTELALVAMSSNSHKVGKLITQCPSLEDLCINRDSSFRTVKPIEISKLGNLNVLVFPLCMLGTKFVTISSIFQLVGSFKKIQELHLVLFKCKIMKPVHRARKASKLAHEDAISRMPENVITDIMNRLPIRDAMRTSNLASNWSSAKFFSSGITLYQQWELVFISSEKLLWQWELITASGNALCILFPTILL